MQDSTGPGPKQLLSERIKNATNILVTVSRDPSVDELSAALALTVMLNKMDKHATAVFSGKIPPAIEFLQPEKTFEGTVDSLRDFIIALDKEKADRLRYKVEDDVVRIFITPYRTIINEKDLAFSQGDFNVELIVALGVEKKEDLDNAISAHGRILHDATVATINITNRESDLGSIDWTDQGASSFSEMLMSLSESLKSGILDEQIATALLTGIVAATERFSNTKTTPKVMTMSAQLMAAGANQQLIATKLQEGSALPQNPQPDGSQQLQEGSSAKVSGSGDKVGQQEEKKAADGEMHVEHDEPTDVDQAVEKATELANSAEAQQADVKQNEAALDQAIQQPAQPASPTLSVEDLKKDLAQANEDLEQAAATPVVNEPISTHGSDWREDPAPAGEPLFGGTLNATTDEAHEAKAREDRLNRNHTILNHDEPLVPQAPLNSDSPGYVGDEPPTIDPFAEPPKSEPSSPMHYEATDTHGQTIQPLPPLPPSLPANEPQQPAESSEAPHIPTLSELEAQAHNTAAANPVNDARAAVNAALETLPFNPANEPLAGNGAQPLSGPSLHDNSSPNTSFAPPPIGSTSPLPAPADVPGLPPPPPLPDFSTLPPLPAEPDASAPAPNPFPAGPAQQFGAAPSAPATPPPSNDPGQFKLPGQ